MVDFLYHGEANVYQEILDSFLVSAEELELRGLRANQLEKEAEVFLKPTRQRSQPESPIYESLPEQFPLNKEMGPENGLVQARSEMAIALIDQSTNNTDIESLDRQVKSRMTLSDNADPYAKKNGRARMCKVCGMEESFPNIVKHIEAKHMIGISVA